MAYITNDFLKNYCPFETVDINFLVDLKNLIESKDLPRTPEDKLERLFLNFFSAQKEERINRGITRIRQKHIMTQNEAKQRFLDIDKIALKQSDFKTDVMFVDTTNYDNNQEITIKKTIEKIITLFYNNL